MKKKLFVGILLIMIIGLGNLSFINPAKAAGAFFYLSPSTGTKTIDTLFTVTLKVNTGEAVINAAEGTLNFDSAKIQAVSINKNGSIFNIWTTEPSFNNTAGVINFAGGIPRPGYSGRSGSLLTVTFKTKAAGEAQINFSSGAILANDGLGTNILTSMGSANYVISPKTEAPDQGQAEVAANEPEKTPKATSSVVTQDSLNNSLAIISVTHPDPDAWSSQNNPEFKWAIPEGATEQNTAFNNDPNFDPGNSNEQLSATKRYESIKDGIWFFHLKYKIGKEWTPVSHYKVQIDSTPPPPFTIQVEQVQAQDLPILYFKAFDGTSGIIRYEVNIGSLEEKGFVVDSQESMLKVPSLEVGPHTAMVKAIDAAGNEVISTVEFIITPIDTPVIKNYSQEIKPSDKFFISGTALADAAVNVYLQKIDGKVITKKTTADRNGLWYLVNDTELTNGRYVAWVEAINTNGLRSEPSAKISFLVSPPVFARLGTFVINYFTILVSLLFMIILVIASVMWITHVVKKRLKKETIEVEEVLHDNMESLKELIDSELLKLSRLQTKTAITKEKTRLKTSLKEKIENTEKKIMKEIKDVEKLLK